MRRIVFAACVFVFSLPGLAMADHLDYAIFSTDDITMKSYSAVGGDIYSGRDLNLDFFYGGQRPALNQGNMYARRDINGESMVRVNGDVYANDNVTFTTSLQISGNVTYGDTLTYGSGGVIQGSTIHSPNSVPIVSLPAMTDFTYGTVDIYSDGDQQLFPGSYRDVVHDGLFKEFHLYSGNYYMKSLQVLKHADIYLHMENGPINIFSDRNIQMDSGADFYVNGERVIDTNTNLNRDLARDVFFETHGNFTIDPGFLNYFFGTIFAPDGTVTLDLQDMYGSVIAGRAISMDGYVDHYTSNYLAQTVPEPSTLTLLAAGCVTLLLLARVRRR